MFRAPNTFQPMLDTRLQTVGEPSKVTMTGRAWQDIRVPGYCCIVRDKMGFKIHPELHLHLLCLAKICSGRNALLWFKKFSHFSHPLLHACHLTLPTDPLAFHLSPAQVTPSLQHRLLGSVPIPIFISCQPVLGTGPQKQVAVARDSSNPPPFGDFHMALWKEAPADQSFLARFPGALWSRQQEQVSLRFPVSD